MRTLVIIYATVKVQLIPHAISPQPPTILQYSNLALRFVARELWQKKDGQDNIVTDSTQNHLA